MVHEFSLTATLAAIPRIEASTAPAVIDCVYHLADWFMSSGMDDDRALDFAAQVLHVDLGAITAVLNRLDTECRAPTLVQ